MSPFTETNKEQQMTINPAVVDLGSIVTSARARAIIYTLVVLSGLALLIGQDVFAFLVTEGVIDRAPVWFGATVRGFLVVSTATAFLSKANAPSPAFAPDLSRRTR